MNDSVIFPVSASDVFAYSYDRGDFETICAILKEGLDNGSIDQEWVLEELMKHPNFKRLMGIMNNTEILNDATPEMKQARFLATILGKLNEDILRGKPEFDAYLARRVREYRESVEHLLRALKDGTLYTIDQK